MLSSDIDDDLRPAETEDASHPAERRMVLRLLRHWRDLCQGREMPPVEALQPEAIAEIWSCCFVLDLSGSDRLPRIKLVGGSFTEEGTDTFGGQPAGKLPQDTLLGRSTLYWRKVVEKRVPISIGGEFRHRDGRMLLYRSIILPLSNDERQIDHLLGAANYRAVVTG